MPSFVVFRVVSMFGPYVFVSTLLVHVYKYSLQNHFILFYSVRSFSCLGLGMGFSNWNFSVKSFRSSAVFGGRLKRPAPCRIRSAPGRDRVRGLSETSEKCAIFRILGGIRPSYSWILAYAELERKKHMGKHLFPNWILMSSPTHFFHCHTSKRLAYCLTTAVSLLFDVGFDG